MKYTITVAKGDFLSGIPTTYTYAFETGMVIERIEMKSIVTGKFTNKVRVTFPSQKTKAGTMRLLNRFLENGSRVSTL